ncbi:MipA/OmpV family protein [Vibrio coralliilyticus]|uniref:outer membrane protein OmpV n=1 Tax=Vibrio TaxID=662 RepID=UPI0004FFCC52|nr:MULTISPECIES: MipA/OmpV family protein [Vibrio]KFI12168.1 membrane protein [Vibrio sp. B183]NOI19234.1 MipA/OmpV family protein [Vibrio coralliilyticus]
MKKLTILVSTLVAATAAHAAGDTYIRNGNIYTKENSWIAELGGAGVSDLYKDQKHNATLLGNFGYQGEDFNASLQGINYRFLGNTGDMFNMSAYLGSSGLMYDHDTSDFLKGMDKRKASLDLGINADFHLSQGTISTYAQHDVTDTYDGYLAGVTYFLPMSVGSMDLVPFAGLTYQSKDYVDYYFGVKDKEATQARKAYKGSGDVSYNLGYKLVLPINDSWELTQTTAYTRLGDNIADSPIVDSANQWTVGATVAYRF